jgi:DNA topoisomerase-2
MMNPPKKSIQDLYVKLEQREHIYKLPDTYIGSAEPSTESMYLLDPVEHTFHLETVTYVPGLYKIMDELLVNAWDQHQRLYRAKRSQPKLHEVKHIDISVDTKTGEFRIRNDGEGIDVEIHPEHQIWIPEMIFGHLLTSTNYNPDSENTTGGKNGYGAKLANVFSLLFQVETVDASRKKRYLQRFEKNMTVIHPPEIQSYSSSPYTEIRLIPDFERFGMMGGWTDTMIRILEKRAMDLAACSSKVRVTFNGKIMPCSNLDTLMDFFPETKDHGKVCEVLHDRWEVGVCFSDGFKQVSYVNGICTLKGGKHVEYILRQLTDKIADHVEKKKKIRIKAPHVRENIMIFVKCLIVNPSFDSQTKETLTTQMSKFGSKCEISDAFMQKLLKLGIVDRVIQLYEMKEQLTMNRNETKRKSRLLGIEKLEDANEAGTSKSKLCTLILTEGDSAKGTALAGIEVVGRDFWGVFPLKGKLLNVREKISTLKGKEQIYKNEELNHLKQILGLETNKKYESIEGLRYGKVMLMTDQDVDGSHIKGLFLNWIDTCWPELLQLGFVSCLVTPIIKVRRQKEKVSFYSIGDYLQWKDSFSSSSTTLRQWEIKYYKGLGTSDSREAKDYFRDLKQIHFLSDGSTCREKIDMAFNRVRAHDRKQWLSDYHIEDVVDMKASTEVSLTKFVDLELKHFSNYDLHRSIGHVMDGFKPSQRKIIYACFKRNLVKEIKVAQLAGYVSEQTGYHHGEESLNKTIVAMAQNFVGSNNINFLQPNGQFGTRLDNGKDHASSRYIFTCLNPLVQDLFPSADFPLLKYVDDDGTSVEPYYYVPILPTVLMNGNCGVGTGYSTDIPCFNPEDIAEYLFHKLRTGEFPTTSLVPYYRGFKGSIHAISDTNFITKGLYKITSYKTIEITELPVGVWTNDYKSFLESMVVDHAPSSKTASSSSSSDKWIKNIRNYCTESKIHFILEVETLDLKTMIKEGKTSPDIDPFEKRLHLISKISLSNMHLFNVEEIITKYQSVHEIIEAFYDIRYDLYQKRKVYLLEKLQHDIVVLENKIRFIDKIIAEELQVHRQSRQQLEQLLKELQFIAICSATSEPSYDYLLQMPIYQMTVDQMENLRKKKDDKMQEYNLLLETSVETIWIQEIERFQKNYQMYLKKLVSAEEEEEQECGTSSSKKKKKTLKSI